MDLRVELHRRALVSRAKRARETPSQTLFLDDRILDGAPSCSAIDFEKPRLRRCRFDLADIDWKASKHLAGGLDGHSWQVFFGKDGPYVLKMFWDLEPPNHYFAPERECLNAAILEMMKASVDQAAINSTKIYINPNPKTKEDALANVYAFTEESRQSQSQDTEALGISSIPHMRKCHGWLKINGRNCQIPSKLWPPTLRVGKLKRCMSGDRDHIAVVYEYIEESENDVGAVAETANFLWRAGFAFTNYPEERNWKNGVLVDLSEIVHVNGYGWKKRDFGPRDVTSLLQ